MGPLNLPIVDRGVLLVVSGPSGAGKSTLVHHALDLVPTLSFSVSCTTRQPRAGEREGVDYHFIDEARFEAMVAAGDFLEHARVYDHGYGTPRAQVESDLAHGRSILLDIDVQGAAQVRASLPEGVHVIILPPSLDALETRLRARGSDDEGVIARRMALADDQIRAASSYDYVVVNDDLAAGRAQLAGIVLAELSRTARLRGQVDALLGELDARCNR